MSQLSYSHICIHCPHIASEVYLKIHTALAGGVQNSIESIVVGALYITAYALLILSVFVSIGIPLFQLWRARKLVKKAEENECFSNSKHMLGTLLDNKRIITFNVVMQSEEPRELFRRHLVGQVSQ